MSDRCDSYILPCAIEWCLYNGAKRLSFARSVRGCCADRNTFQTAPPCPDGAPKKADWSEAKDVRPRTT